MHYENLVVITTPYQALELKEFLDIALVSSSYDKQTAIYLSALVVKQIQTLEDTNLAYSLNMLAEFSVPIFSEKSAELINLVVKEANLSELKSSSQNIFPF